MKKIALITHSFHKLTKSADLYMEEFFSDKSKFTYDIFFNDEWKGSEKKYEFNTKISNYDAVIVSQIISKNVIKNIECENIIFMPMYDSSKNFNKDKVELWLTIAGVKILTPLKEMENILKISGLNSYNFKFYPKAETYQKPNVNNVFFWNRVESIDYKLVLKLLENFNFKQLNIHKSFDPGQKPKQPSPAEIEKNNITYTSWFETKNEFLNFLNKFGIYIVPRPFEGGGFASFMDALKKGMIVVAPNHSPFNEYIDNGHNGFLYNYKNPEPIDFSKFNLDKISINAHKSVELGRKNWVESLEGLHNFIFKQNNYPNSLIYNKNIVKVLDDKWFNFGKLNKLNKIKVLIKHFFNFPNR